MNVDPLREAPARRRQRLATKVTLIYATAGALWILFSDELLFRLVGEDAPALARLQTFKGWFFIGITALLLNVLVHRAIAVEAGIAARLRQSESRFRAIFDGVNDPIFLHDPDNGRIIDVNACACELYGFPRDELCATPIGELSENVPPFTQVEAMQWFERVRPLRRGKPARDVRPDPDKRR